MKITALIFLTITNAILASNINLASCPIERKANFINHTKIIDEKIKGYYDNDDLEDYIINDPKNKETYSIFINNGKGYTKKVSFVVAHKDFETIDNPLENLFISNPQKGEIIIGASCCGSFKCTELNYYKFFDEIYNWVLYKKSTSIVQSDLIPTIQINYLDYSNLIDGKTANNKKIKENELLKREKKNEVFFDTLFTKYKQANENKSINTISGNLSLDEIADLLYTIPINKKNINKYNDLAYYIGVCKDGKISSIFLLKNIIKKDPDRVVAYLNLGNAQWGMEDKEHAKESYQKYISLMKSQGQDLNKIPKRVYERIK